jgi:uncharacterized protein YndB with AHSA1/START domain
MKKELLHIEYPLKNASIPILWKCIGTPLGLSEWFANAITVVDSEYTFIWEESEQTAKLVQFKVNNFIRFQWIEDEGTEAYFEIKIMKEAISNELTLNVTDYVLNNEKDDTILLWNKQINELKRKTGI